MSISRLGDFFAGFTCGLVNFFSELVREGAAMTGLERPRFMERGRTGACPRALSLLLLLLPARRSSREISLTDFLAEELAATCPLIECLLDERIISLINSRNLIVNDSRQYNLLKGFWGFGVLGFFCLKFIKHNSRFSLF